MVFGVKMPKYEPGKTLVGLYCICLVLPSFLSSFLPSIRQPIHPHQTNFRRTFLKNCKGYKVETWYPWHTTHIPSGLMYCIYWNQAKGLWVLEFNPVIGFTICQKWKNSQVLQFTINEKFHYRFLRNCERLGSCKAEIWYTHGQWADV